MLVSQLFGLFEIVFLILMLHSEWMVWGGFQGVVVVMMYLCMYLFINKVHPDHFAASPSPEVCF